MRTGRTYHSRPPDALVSCRFGAKVVASGTVRLDFQILKAAWRWGAEWDVCKGTLKAPPVKHRPVRDKYTPTFAEVDAAIAEAAPPWVRRFLSLCRYSGARHGEVPALLWEDVDLRRAELTIRSGEWRKTGGRQVAIPEDLVAFLSETPKAERVGRVVGPAPSSLRSLTDQRVREACRKAKVREFTSHGVRRAVIDAYYESGADVGTVAAQLG